MSLFRGVFEINLFTQMVSKAPCSILENSSLNKIIFSKIYVLLDYDILISQFY